MKAKAKHGGRRSGAGRPPKAPPEVPKPSAAVDWAMVERFANVGSSEEEIVAGLGITDAQLKVPETAERLRDAVARGSALKKLMLREEIDKLGRGEARGSSNTLRLQAQALLGWEKQTESEEPPPDLTSAHARLRLTLERLAKVASEEHGREVTPAEVLLSDVLPKKDEPVH